MTPTDAPRPPALIVTAAAGARDEHAAALAAALSDAIAADAIAAEPASDVDGPAPNHRLGPTALRLALRPEVEPAKALDAARAQLEGAQLDVNLETPRKTLLFADMDSTIITVECVDELAAAMGVGPQVAAITARAMAGEIDFEGALTERVQLLDGAPLTLLQEVFDSSVQLSPGAEILVGTMRGWGAHAELVSGGFTFFTERVAARAGFERHRANRLLDDGARLTGKVAQPILGRDAKRAALQAALDKTGRRAADALAVGDGANDLAMIDLAGLGVAYRAKPAVAAAADARLDWSDLTAVLHLQGVRARDFLAGASGNVVRSRPNASTD